jgi:hypothetical protein
VAALAVGAAATPVDFFFLFQASWLPAPSDAVMIAASALLFPLWTVLTLGAFMRRESKAWWSLMVAPLVALGPALVVLVTIGCMFGSCI